MKNTKKGPFKNQLAFIRQRGHLNKKQVSRLLGHSNTGRIEDYERGIKTPNLKTALKLAHIYGIPVRVMLDGYFEAVHDEIKKEELRMVVKTRGNGRPFVRPISADFCSIESRLDGSSPEGREISQARRHTAALIRKTAEKLGHI